MSTFGQRIKELRLACGITQKQMADILGITERNYQRYEATNSPSNENLLRLANLFGVTTDYLLGRSDFPFPPEEILTDEQRKQLSVSNTVELSSDQGRIIATIKARIESFARKSAEDNQKSAPDKE